MTLANRVLIVDDDPPTCELIGDVLGAAEIEAHILTSSAAAAQRLGQERFDAFFLDARMPSPDGLELTRQIRASSMNRKSVVVMITGERERHFMTRAFELGVNFFLSKPVDRQALLRLIRVTQGPIDRERRRFTRVDVQLKVSVKCGQEQAQATTVDLSATGMLVKSAQRFQVGSLAQVELELDAGKFPLRCSARVMHLTGGDSMGLEFENIRPADGERLQEFLLPHILRLQGSTVAKATHS